MKRLLLRGLNAPVLVLLALVAIAIQTSLFAYWPLNYIQPDIVLLLTLWCAFRRNFAEGGILTLIFAHVAEIHSSVPQGLFLTIYMLIYLLIRGTSRFFVVPDLFLMAVITLFSSIFVKISGAMYIYFLRGTSHPWLNSAFLLFPGAAAEGIASIWVYRWLHRFDQMTFKSRQIDDSDTIFSGDSDYLDSEGF